MSSIPLCFEAYIAAWNSRVESTMRAFVDQAISPDVVFCDPNHNITGREAFVAMVLDFQNKFPGCEVVRTSGVDQHHHCARYSWGINAAGARRFDGFDAVELDIATRKMVRINGFFGPLPTI